MKSSKIFIKESKHKGIQMNIDQIIKQTILRLDEKKDEPKAGKKIKAKVGRGNLKTYIKQGKSRAENDPDGLMRDLGIPPSFSKEPKIVNLEFRQQIAALLRRSFEKDPAMSQAFLGVRYTQGSTEAYVKTDSELISSRDATMFINNILRAAQNADSITLSEDVEISASGKEEVYILFIQD